MRLREIQKVLKESSSQLQLQVTPLSKSNSKVSNIQQTLQAVRAIATTGLFPDLITSIEKIEEISLTSYDSLTIPTEVVQRFTTPINQLQQSVSITQHAFRDLLGEPNEYGVDIRLPDIGDLKDLQEVIASLDKVFNQLLVNDYIKGKVTLQSFDTGSLWFGFIIEGIVALKLVASLVGTIITLKTKKLQNEKLLEDNRTHNIANNLLEQLSKDLLLQYNQLKQLQIRQIIKEGGIPEDDHEYQKRIELCLETMTKLIERGLQVVPSSNVPEEIQAKFPDFSKPLEMMLPLLKKELPISATEQESG